jgi:hypothetical protein
VPPSAEFVRQNLTAAVDSALEVNQSLVLHHLARTRRSRPDASPAEILDALENQYVAAVAGLGAVGGAAAAVPGPWSPAAVAINVAEVGTFLEASLVFILAVAEVHGVTVEDVERRRTLLIAVLLGNSGSAVVREAAGRTAPYWGRAVVRGIPMTAVRSANRVLGRNFITKYGTKQGILVLGRQVPFGLGALIGAGGNVALAWTTVHAARRAFGPPPDQCPTPPADPGLKQRYVEEQG